MGGAAGLWDTLRDQGKGETLGPVLEVYENRDVVNADVNCY